MIDHMGLRVSNLEKSRALYETALAPIDFVVVMEFADSVVFGTQGRPWFGLRESFTQDETLGIDPAAEGFRVAPIHLALRAPSRASVDGFHQAALSAGGRDNGAPGIRSQYHANYYSAYILDFDGNNLEAVRHDPE